MHRPALPLVLLLLVSSLVLAQERRCDPAHLRVKVLYSNSRSAHEHTRVDLLTSGGLLATFLFSDDSGNVEFENIPAGGYRIRVNDPLVEDTSSDVIGLACGERRTELFTAQLKAEAEVVERQIQAKEAMVSAMELNVPSGARKEFEKGASALEDNARPEAEKHFLRAIDLYPSYALAYNHLGVLYMMNGDQAKGRDAFEKAVALNDHYPSALLNLAKIRYQERKLPEAEDLLRKATAIDASNPEMIALLANAEFINGRIDDGLANTVKLHAMAHGPYATVHYVAGQALEAKNRNSEAITQYSLYLQESPAGSGSVKAKLALGRLRAQGSAQPAER
jgi:tetratricopeptide (TPR) repeat protein